MATVERKVDIYEVDYVCDKCGEGRMRPTGIVLTSDPPQYPHRCTKCDCHKNFGSSYPTRVYRKVEQ